MNYWIKLTTGGRRNLMIFSFAVILFLQTAKARQRLDSNTVQVDVVEGLNVSLPCHVDIPTDDQTALVLWYLGPEETPVFTYDQREGSNGTKWFDSVIFGNNRVSYHPYASPPFLHLTNVRRDDGRIYKCRMDFMRSKSKMAFVRLLVIVPTQIIEFNVAQQSVMPGSRDDVTCVASGGWPPARVVWLQDGQVVDAKYNIKNGRSFNALEAGASRGDLTSPFVCQASNNDITTPITREYTRNVTFGPLNVMIEVSTWPQVEGMEVTIKCTVVGSNPPAKVTWYQHSSELRMGTVNVTRVDDVTISVLKIIPTRELHGRQIVCRAENPMVIRPGVEDIVTLDVTYRPNVTATLLWPQYPSNLQEGTKLLLQCHVDANPPPYQFAWLHNGREMRANQSSGYLLTDSKLTVLRVTREMSGAYQCSAENSEGSAISNVVTVKIKYAPRCIVSNTIRGLTLFESVRLHCKVDADPTNVTFRWTLTSTSGEEKLRLLPDTMFRSQDMQSTLRYTATGPEDFGVITCEADNGVTTQHIPCRTTLVSVGPPDEVRGCMVTNETRTSVTINCMAGFNGGLRQRFQLHIRDFQNERLVYSDTLEVGSKFSPNSTIRFHNISRIYNTTNYEDKLLYHNINDEYGKERNNDVVESILRTRDDFQPERIQFYVPNLLPSRKYFAAVTAINSRGHSKAKKFQIHTLGDLTPKTFSSAKPARRKTTYSKKRDFPTVTRIVTPAPTTKTSTNAGPIVQDMKTNEVSPVSRIFLWVIAILLGICLAIFGIGAGVYLGKRQIVTCWYLTCGKLCRGECCRNFRSKMACVGCLKRCKARCEDCPGQMTGCCSTGYCREQLTGCACLVTAYTQIRTGQISKCCVAKDRRKEVDDEDGERGEDGEDDISRSEKGCVVCCGEMRWTKKMKRNKNNFDTASGLRGPALQLHRGGTLLLKRALSGGETTSGSIKKHNENEGVYMNGVFEQTIYDSQGRYRGFAHIPRPMHVGIRHASLTPEVTSEAAPNSSCPSDPLLVNGKKLVFSEPSRISLRANKQNSKEEKREEGDAKSPDKEKEGVEESNKEEQEEETSMAPKLSTVLRNFRPPSLAKFVTTATKPTKTTAGTPGCDV